WSAHPVGGGRLRPSPPATRQISEPALGDRALSTRGGTPEASVPPELRVTDGAALRYGLLLALRILDEDVRAVHLDDPLADPAHAGQILGRRERTVLLTIPDDRLREGRTDACQLARKRFRVGRVHVHGPRERRR